MQRLEVSGAVRPIYGSLGVKGLSSTHVSAVRPYGDITGEVTNKIKLPSFIQQMLPKKLASRRKLIAIKIE